MSKHDEMLIRSAWPGKTPHLSVDVTVESAGWEFCGLKVLHLAPGETWSGSGEHDEFGLVALGGTCDVTALGQTWSLGERANVFSGPPWALYLPVGTEFTVSAATTLEVAICSARAEERHPARLISPDQVAIEIRGAGNAARQINHIIKPEFQAHRLLIVEVFTPSGNWSSYPPHKHDISRMPAEADLEEIYYYRINPDDGFGLQRLYNDDRSLDLAWPIHDGDLLLVPEGYHAFAVAQGYTGYYLNVLAGAEPVRTMQPADDPRYNWIRSTWADQQNEGARSWQEISKRVNRGAGERIN